MLAVLDLARAEALVRTPLSYLSDLCSWSWQEGWGYKIGASLCTHGIITNIMWCRTIVRTVISECLSRIPRISGFVDEGDIMVRNCDWILSRCADRQNQRWQSLDYKYSPS
jgi:hypothetical protein